MNDIHEKILPYLTTYQYHTIPVVDFMYYYGGDRKAKLPGAFWKVINDIINDKNLNVIARADLVKAHCHDACRVDMTSGAYLLDRLDKVEWDHLVMAIAGLPIGAATMTVTDFKRKHGVNGLGDTVMEYIGLSPEFDGDTQLVIKLTEMVADLECALSNCR